MDKQASIARRARPESRRLTLESGSPYAFKLLLVLLTFNVFRPDRLLPGGSVLVYFPTFILGILFLQWISSPKKKVHNLQTRCLIYFVVLALFQFAFVRNRGLAYLALKGFLPYVFIAYLVHVQFIDSFPKMERFMKIYFLLNLFLAVMAILGKGRISIPVLDDQNDYGLFLNCLIPIGFFLGQAENDKRKKIIYYLGLCICVLGNIATSSRGGFIGLLGVGAFLLYKSKYKLHTLILAGTIVLLVHSFAPQRYWDRMATIWTEGGEAGTGKERVESWKAAWKIFLDHPILGVGPYNYGAWLAEKYAYENPHTMWGRVAHSLYFTLLPEMGVVGTLLFLGILWGNYQNHMYLLRLRNKKNRVLRGLGSGKKVPPLGRKIERAYFLSLGYAGAMVAYLVTGIFISVLYYSYFWVLSSFWVITANAGRKMEEELNELGERQLVENEAGQGTNFNFRRGPRIDWVSSSPGGGQ